MEIYLDNAATTRPRAEVVKAILECYEKVYGNPSSAHKMGIEAEKKVKWSREVVAKALGVKPDEIYFTSGGTESNNTALKGVAGARKKHGKHIITTTIEHPSVLKTCTQLADEGFELTVLEVNKEGLIDLGSLSDAIRQDTILVSVMHVNNEIGVMEPIAEIGKLIKERNSNTIFHVDAVQSFGKIPLRPSSWGVDLLSLSGHKIHGPKGIGALYIKKGVRIVPLLSGGGQERDLRSGTENVPAIIGLGTASEMASANINQSMKYVSNIREKLRNGLLASIPEIRINTPLENAAPHILNVSFRGVKGEVLLHSLEEKGIFVSTGSACSAKKLLVSNVLKALGLSKSELEGGIRFSFSVNNTQEEISKVIAVTSTIVEELRKYARR